MNKKNLFGFTLIELLIVIIILGVLSALISGNFFTSLKKGRDARRKADLEQIQRALEMYYEDKRAYPITITFGSSLTDSVSGKTYMQKVPTDPVSSYSYQYQSDGTYYRLFSCIENNLDQGPGISQNGFDGALGNCNCEKCRYTISSPNITPLPTSTP